MRFWSTVALVAVVVLGTAGGASAKSEVPNSVKKVVIVKSRTVSESCPGHVAGLIFYRSRFVQHMLQMGTVKVDFTRPRNCARAVYLAHRWQARAYKARVALAHWRVEQHQRSVEQVVQRLDRGLQGSPMAGTGVYLEKYGRLYHVSPYFMAAVAATESSLGAAGCGSGGYNAWGLGNCGSAWSVPSFGSWNEAIAYYAKFLTRWSGHTSPYSFSGYAACDACWARKVSSYMSSLFGVPARTAYP